MLTASQMHPFPTYLLCFAAITYHNAAPCDCVGHERMPPFALIRLHFRRATHAVVHIALAAAQHHRPTLLRIQGSDQGSDSVPMLLRPFPTPRFAREKCNACAFFVSPCSHHHSCILFPHTCSRLQPAHTTSSSAATTSVVSKCCHSHWTIK